MPKLRFTHEGGRELVLQVSCTCLSKSVQGAFRKVYLTGEASEYFFDEVNSKPLHGKCLCGRAYTYQWFRDGVEFAFDDTLPKKRGAR